MGKANGLEALLRGRRRTKSARAETILEQPAPAQMLLNSAFEDPDADEEERLEAEADLAARVVREPSNEMIDRFLRRPL